MRRPRRRLTVALAVSAALVVVPTLAYAASTIISISGATASFPLIELLATKYHQVEKGKVSFKISQGGASVGISDVAAGRVNIGDSSRPPATTDPTGLVFYPIAKYFVCVVTNPANPITNLTAAQVRRSSPARSAAGARSPERPPPGRSTSTAAHRSPAF